MTLLSNIVLAGRKIRHADFLSRYIIVDKVNAKYVYSRLM